MAALAGDGGLISEILPHQVPRAFGVDRLHQVAHRAIEVHAVTSETILHQMLFGVLRIVREDLAIGGAVGAGVPGGVFLLMTLLTVFCHSNHVNIA